MSSSYNQIFRSHANVNELYKGLSSIINKFELTTLGTCINMNGLNYYYSGGTNDKLTIALHMLLENYCHFLISHDAQGSVCYESLNEPGNQGLRQRFYELKALGSLYYTSSCFQKHILEISFLEKSKNITGLQLADFIPNTQARQAAGLKPKHNDFKKNVIRHAYDGKLDMKNKFGLKTIP